MGVGRSVGRGRLVAVTGQGVAPGLRSPIQKPPTIFQHGESSEVTVEAPVASPVLCLVANAPLPMSSLLTPKPVPRTVSVSKTRPLNVEEISIPTSWSDSTRVSLFVFIRVW